MQVQIHQAELERCNHKLCTVKRFVLQKLFLRAIKRIVVWVCKECLCRKEKAAATAARVSNGLIGFRAQAGNHCLDERARGKILSCAAFYVLCILLQQSFVNLALHIRGHGDPFFLVDHLHHTVQDGDIADFIDSALEDLSEDAAFFAQPLQRSTVLVFQLRTLEGVHICPRISLWDSGFPLIRRAGIFIGHFQENQVSKLLKIIAIGYAIIPQRIAKSPDFGDDIGRLFTH